MVHIAFGTIPGFRHPLGGLEHIPSGQGERLWLTMEGEILIKFMLNLRKYNKLFLSLKTLIS